MKQIIRLTESDLHRIVKESVRNILRECGYGSDISTDTGMIQDGVDEEGEIAGATNAQSSGQVLKGSGIETNRKFLGNTVGRDNVTNMGETDPRM